MTSHTSKSDKIRQAIIDIGSNAIRAVVYDDQKLGAPEIYNDKFRSDLVSLLELDNLDVKHQIYLAIQYFNTIFQRLGVEKIDCVATAILRNHPKAEEFVQIVQEKYGIYVEVISGEKEAFLTASGLISGITDANGIAVDLGGGSLEIVEVQNKQVGHLRSLPIGTKVIEEGADVAQVVEMIKSAEFVHHDQCQHLYLIGGAFRFIGRHYMEFVRYPLRNLHNLEVDTQDFLIYIEKLDNIAKIKPLYQSKRIDQRAIVIAKALIEVLAPEKIVISNYGLKEGVRFVHLDPEERQKNIIFERCKTLAEFDESATNLIKYNKLITHLLVDPDQPTQEIVDLVVILSSYNKNIDRTLKASFIAEFILSCDIPFSHRQRLMLGLAMSYAFSSKSDLYIHKLAKRALVKADCYNSKIIGSIIRIIREVDGPEFKAPSFNLQIRDKYIEITTKDILPRQVFDHICDRLKDISNCRKAIR